MDADLVGKRVTMKISDPWDLVTRLGSGPFEGQIVRLRRAGKGLAAVLHLTEPIVLSGTEIRFLLVMPRFVNAKFAVSPGGTTNATFLEIGADDAAAEQPVDMKRPLGGTGFIGTLTVEGP